MQLLDGKALAKKIRDRIKKETDELLKERDIIPGLLYFSRVIDPSRSFLLLKLKEEGPW